jgi:hypothetical protein
MQGPPTLNYWCFRAWRYLFALSGLPVCAISSLPKASLDLSSERSPWYELRECFSFRGMADRYVNVVCGIGDDVHRLYTVGMPNLAITGVYTGIGTVEPKADEVESLKKYDAVICPTVADAQFLKSRYGIDATCVPPDPHLLTPLIERLLHERPQT